jgi:hypothetical protein
MQAYSVRRADRDITFSKAHEGTLPSVTRRFQWDLYQFVELDETRRSLKEFVPIRCPSRVMTVLLCERICGKTDLRDFDLKFCSQIGVVVLRMS